MAWNVGPVGPVRKPGNSTSGQPNNQGNGKSNTKKQQPKQPNSVFGDGFKKDEVSPQSGQVAPLGQPWNLDINGNPTTSELLLKGSLTADELPEGRAIYDTKDKFNPTGADLANVTSWLGGPEGAIATGIDTYNNTKNVPLSIGMGAIGFLPIGKAISKASEPIMNTVKQIPFSDQTLLGFLNRNIRGLNKPVTENVYDITRDMPTKMPPMNIKGEGTNHNLVSRVKDGQTFKEGDIYKVYDGDSGTFKDKKMSKELANNLNHRVELQKEKGKIPIYSDTGTIHGIPEDVKYADDLIDDANLIEAQQNAFNANVMNMKYGYDPSLAENVLLSNLNNKAAIDAYRRPYGEPLPMSDIYNHYSYEPVESVKRGIVGSRAGDNLNMGGTGAIYLTDDATTLGGFPYKNEFIGPSKDLFIQPYEMGVNDLDPVTSARLKELANGYGRMYDPEYISHYFIEKSLNKGNPQIGVLQQGANEANIDNAFNRILRQGGYAGFQDTHDVWNGRALEPFQEYGLLRPEDLFYTGTSLLNNKVPKELRRL